MKAPVDQRTLASLCQTWANQETQFLEEVLDAVGKVRRTLVGGDLEQMAAELRDQDKLAEIHERRRSERLRFRQSLGAALKVPAESVTLEQAAHALPAEARRGLHTARQRLRGLASEIAKANHANALFCHYFQDFVQRFLVELTGGAGAGGRYGRDGALHAPACGSLLQAQG